MLCKKTRTPPVKNDLTKHQTCQEKQATYNLTQSLYRMTTSLDMYMYPLIQATRCKSMAKVVKQVIEPNQGVAPISACLRSDEAEKQDEEELCCVSHHNGGALDPLGRADSSTHLANSRKNSRPASRFFGQWYLMGQGQRPIFFPSTKINSAMYQEFACYKEWIGGKFVPETVTFMQN